MLLDLQGHGSIESVFLRYRVPIDWNDRTGAFLAWRLGLQLDDIAVELTIDEFCKGLVTPFVYPFIDSAPVLALIRKSARVSRPAS